MTLSRQDSALIYLRAREFTLWLSDEAYGNGVKPKHPHYTRSQSKKYGMNYQAWNECPTVRGEVMARFNECQRLMCFLHSQTTTFLQLIDDSEGWFEKKSIHASFCEIGEFIMSSIESIFLQNKPFFFFMDDELSIDVNNFLWKLTEVYFFAMHSFFSSPIYN